MDKLKPMTFTIDPDQMVKLNEWLKTKPFKYEGAIGGRFTYSFHPTSLGIVTKVKDELLGDEIDLSDYRSW